MKRNLEVVQNIYAAFGRQDLPTMRDEEIHLWTLNAEGKVVRFRHYCDTAKHMRAANKG